MPYIKETDRWHLEDGGLAMTAGELNYQITTVIMEYLIGQGTTSYKSINDILGALEGAKLEFYRRIVVPYEQEKIEENGDVYE